MSIWDDLADKQQVESEVSFDDLPAKKWVLGQVAGPSDGGAAPCVKQIGDKDLYQFGMGLRCRGGEPTLDSKYNGRFTFFKAWVHPFADGEEAAAGNVMSGQLLGALNAMISPGVGENFMEALGKEASKDEKDEAKKNRSLARWKNTLKVLEATATANGLDLDEYDGNVGLFLAACASVYLTEEDVYVLFRTRERKGKTRDGNEFKEVVAGGLEDLTAANVTGRKIQFFDEDNRPEIGGTQF